MRHKQVVVIGSSDETGYHEEASAIGAHIAGRGFVLITGGRGGIMESVSRGAAEQGGIVVGIHPGEDLDLANPFCSIVIPTGMGYARNAINILAADVIVAIGGKSGTLSELAYAKTYGKPVICCTFAGGWSAAFPQIHIDGQEDGLFMTAENPAEACRLIDEIIAGSTT
jgi:uncharacterized protein (TIGR00725 family)